MSETDNKSILRAEGLRKAYKQRVVVKGSTLEVRQGECVGLLGPNGAGKTTTFYMITGMIRPDAGSVYLDQNNITTTPMYQRARSGVAYLPQEPSIFRRLTVEQNILAVLQLQKLTSAERKDRLETLLDEFGIGHIRSSLGMVLSGGERRRCEIARALATDPKFVLLDEPFAGIDPIAANAFVDRIETLCETLAIPKRLRDIGVHRDQLPLLVSGSRGNSMSGNPREIRDDKLADILHEMW